MVQDVRLVRVKQFSTPWPEVTHTHTWSTPNCAGGRTWPKAQCGNGHVWPITLSITIISNKLAGNAAQGAAGLGLELGTRVGVGIVRAWRGQFMLTFWAG